MDMMEDTDCCRALIRVLDLFQNAKDEGRPLYSRC